MSLYLPNPCLLGIFLTISTYDGPQLVFHYPPKPNEYGYKATPLAQDRTYLKSTGAVESSSDSDSTSDSSDSEDGDLERDSETEDGNSSVTQHQSSRTDSFNTHRSYTDDNNNYLSGKALLDILDEQDRRRKRKENKKKKLMKNIMLSNIDNSIDLATADSSQPNSNYNAKVKDNMSHATSYTNQKTEKLSSLTKLFGFEIDILSELITPAKRLCNTRFEITVDDMSFLGLPIHIYEDGSWKKSHKARTRTSKKMSKKSFHSGSENDEDDNDDNGVNNDGEDDADHEHDDNEKAHDDGKASFNENETSERSSQKEDKCPMNMFHLVFAMNPPVVEYNHRIDEMYHYIISRLTLVLRYEQHKSNFVYNEAMKILTIKDENPDMALNDLWLKIINESSMANVIYQTYRSVMNNDIVSVDINNKIRSFQIPLKNEFTSLPPTTVSILRGSYLSSINPLFNNDAEMEDNDTLLHFALLLLDDADMIIQDIQADKDSIIANFIRLIKPTESLNKLSTISGLDLNQIFSFCMHLVLWRRAIVVPPLQTRNVYIVSPLAPLKNILKDLEVFKTQFPSLPSLPTFLSMLSLHSKPRPYSFLLPSRDHRELYLEALGWLLKAGYALQLHTFLWLKVTSKIRVAVDEEIEMENFKKRENAQTVNGNSHQTTNSKGVGVTGGAGGEDADVKQQQTQQLMTDNLVDNTLQGLERLDINKSKTRKKQDKKIVVVEEEDTILLDPERASALERRWISKIIEGKPPELIALFYRILKYFNGKNALEIILVKENISRQDIKRLLSSIDDYIVNVKHW